jgi:Type II secretion system (T2SS), protein E, N-terminal domain
MASIRLGDLLVKAKVINEGQLKAALGEQQKWGGKLGEILVRMSVVSEDLLVKALSKQLNVPTANLEQVAEIAPHVRAKIPAEVARDLVALPLLLKDEGKTLVVVMAEPQNLKQVDTLRSVSRLRIQPQIAGRQAIARAFARLYGAGHPELGDADGNFKVLDSLGNTVVKAGEAPPAASGPVAIPRTSVVSAPRPALDLAPPPVQPTAPTVPTARSPRELLEALTEAQIKEVGVLKGLIALLIEKGVFTREEYLAKVRR